eukprot:869093-Pleurochrysis_carterae.AAC.1
MSPPYKTQTSWECARSSVRLFKDETQYSYSCFCAYDASQQTRMMCLEARIDCRHPSFDTLDDPLFVLADPDHSLRVHVCAAGERLDAVLAGNSTADKVDAVGHDPQVDHVRQTVALVA